MTIAGEHRIALFVFRQYRRINVQDLQQYRYGTDLQSRYYFDMARFVSASGCEQTPEEGNYFRIESDSSVSTSVSRSVGSGYHVIVRQFFFVSSQTWAEGVRGWG